MNYKLHLPTNYTPPPLPGRDEWVSDLRANPDKQLTGKLGWPDGPNCPLGRLSLLQGRLNARGIDGEKADANLAPWACLSTHNPLFPILGGAGNFPARVFVTINSHLFERTCVAECADDGLTFEQTAEIISKIWSHGGPLTK